MSKTIHRIALAAASAAIVLVAAAPAAHGQAFGRFVITVQDEQGEPIEGVKVTATCEKLPQFRQQVTTDKQGRAHLSVVDATHPYQFTFEHEGYLPGTLSMEGKIRDTARGEVTMLKKAAATPAPAAEQKEVAQPRLTRDAEIFNEGVKALQEKDLATAKERFLAALEINSRLAPAHSGLAGIYLEEGNPEAALAEVEKLLEMEPESARGYRLRYDAYKALGREAEAKQALKDLSQLQEGSDAAVIVYNEGVAALRVGDRAAAKARFEEALELNPDLGAATSALAVVHLNEGEHARAAALAEKLLAADPDNLQAKRVRFDAYRLLGDAAKEQEAFEALAAADPASAAEFLYEAGVKLFDAGQMEEAAKMLARARQLQPENPDVLYRLGLAYVNLEQKAEAKETLGKFLELAPDHPEASVARDMLSYLGS